MFQKESEIIERIRLFRHGYSHFLNQFINQSNGFLNFLSSNAVPETTKRELIPVRKDMDTYVLQAVQKAKDLLLEIDEKHLVPIARKDLVSYFADGIIDQSRLDFVMFHKIFEGLREFYNVGLESWKEIRNLTLSVPVSNENFRTESLLRFRILPVLDSLDNLKLFLDRMAIILGIEDLDHYHKQKKTKPKYKETEDYRLSSIFREGLKKSAGEEIITDFEITTARLEAQDKIVIPTIEEDIPEYSVRFQSSSQKSAPNVLNTAGKLPWNSNQHYFFRYEPEKVEEERKYFQNVINLDTHLGADEKALRTEIIRSITSKEMKKKTPEQLEGEYMIFLDQFFEFCRNILLMGMGIPDSLKYLFFYHIGPQHFYMIVKKFLQEAGTGYLHVRSSDGKKVTKILPSEILKKHVVTFWHREILPHLGEEKNNLAALKKIIEIVDVKYKEMSQHAIREYEALPPEIKNSKPKVQIFRERMNTWMGAANIIVFKRFLKTAL